MTEGRIRVPFPFAAVPHSVTEGLARAELDQTRFAILVVLYRSANRRTWRVQMSLSQLAEHLAWTKSEDWLSKRLRSLRAEGWLHYVAKPGRREQRYMITLHYERANSAEHRPERYPQPRPQPMSPNTEHVHVAMRPVRTDRSERLPARPSVAGPEPLLEAPHSPQDEMAGNDDNYWARELERVRHIENAREKPKAGIEEKPARSSSLTKRFKGPKGADLQSAVTQPSLFGTDDCEEQT